ncbi:flavodoxin [Photobacterium aquae]|uniref:Flavodoxin n=1 Tax=Photobacterium aquae TaxID=1195763 RepID=A0A0J1H9Z0_9GAMM|nr:flavodoxin [Photobacterium aquae]KLV08496.1 flavodoxin [Photobacterium aquae]
MARIGVFVGSVFGGAEDVADAVTEFLTAQGHEAEMFTVATLDEFLGYRSDRVLVISSTTGQGEIPENLLPLFQMLRDHFPLLPDLGYGVVAMGDSSYGEDRYCGAGRQFDTLLTELQAKPLAPRLDVDACIHFDPLEVVMPWLQEWLVQAEAA